MTLVLTSVAMLVLNLAEPQSLHILVDPRRPPSATCTGSLPEALKLVEAAPAGTPALEIEIAEGVFEIPSTLRIGPLPAPLKIHGAGGGTRLIGGAAFHELPRAVDENDPVHVRLPQEAVGRVRWIDMRAISDPKNIWAGMAKISGPVRHGMNLPPGAGSELFWNGTPLTPAHWPNDGFAAIDEVVDPGSSKDSAGRVENPRGGTFRFADQARLRRWASAGDVWLSGYWHRDWADDEMPCGKIDVDAGTITLGLPHTYGVSKGGRFRVVNIPEELDAPGEYWLDTAQERAYFLPPAKESSADANPPELIVSLLPDPIITLDGASNVQITDLRMEAGRSEAVLARNVSGVRIERCEFRNLGTTAVELDGHDSAIVACSFQDIGASGASITGGDRATLTHANNVVRDCTFRRCGRTHRTYQPAVRLDGVGQVVSNNRIEELPHSAVIFAGNEHTIELNDISRVLLETGDSGAIYCGRDWTLHGTIIRHNLFHDIQGSDARYQNAVYLDDMASGITVEGNIFERCHWGMLIGGGRDIRITGNIFDACSKGMSFDARGVGWMAKNLADPAKSTLHQRLKAVPIDREPWVSRYPTLGQYLTDRFGRPVGGRVDGNLFFATPIGHIADRECVRVEANVEVKNPLDTSFVQRLLDPTTRRTLPDLQPPEAPKSFKAIPVARIGPSSPPNR